MLSMPERFSLTVLGCDGSYPGRAVAAAATCSGGRLCDLDGRRARDYGQPPAARSAGATGRRRDQPCPSRPLERPGGPLRGHALFPGPHRASPCMPPRACATLMVGEKPDGTFDWRVIGDGETAQVGPARWNWSRTDHPVETLAARVEVGGRALGYSADTGPAWDVERSGGRHPIGPSGGNA